VADPDDGAHGPDDLELIAREDGVVPAFRWPDDRDEVEACLLRLHRGETTEGELAVLEIAALDGSWREDFLVGAHHLEAAVRGAGGNARRLGRLEDRG